VNRTKRKKLEAKGWRLGDTKDFLALSNEEMAFIEMKLALGQELRERRQRKRLSQVELARRISSSQSRVAKMEAGDASVSMDLLIKSLLVLGASRKELARSIEQSRRAA
jgi:ribosome-binding protein aMBF1 (putative translation factor)